MINLLEFLHLLPKNYQSGFKTSIIAYKVLITYLIYTYPLNRFMDFLNDEDNPLIIFEKRRELFQFLGANRSGIIINHVPAFAHILPQASRITAQSGLDPIVINRKQ
jgi:hypothetical protein